MKRRVLVLLGVVLCSIASAVAQNYDKDKVGNYPLPDPLTFANGKKVKSKKDWPKRREEILEIFQSEMYGRIPAAPETVVWEIIEQGTTLGGYATRHQIRMWFKADKSGPKVDWLLVTPNHIKEPVPVVLMLNYNGNQTILRDKEIDINPNWQRNDPAKDIKNNRATEFSRGLFHDPYQRSMIPASTIIAKGYAVLTACYTDLSSDPSYWDKDENGEPLQGKITYNGIFELWGERDESRTDNTTALGAWAWALSRGMDMIEKLELLDHKRVLLTGSSRLAKAALVSAAFDERYACVVINQTGGGGVPLHKHYYGENVETMARYFPHWYCKAYAKYVNNEQAMPFDQHMLLACIAPRPLLIQGFDDPWYDTEGEYMAVKAASPVWKFLGKSGMPDVEWPDDYDLSAVGEYLGYYRRDNLHGIAAYDWEQMFKFADKFFFAE